MSAHPYVSEWREGHLSEPCTSTTRMFVRMGGGD